MSTVGIPPEFDVRLRAEGFLALTVPPGTDVDAAAAQALSDRLFELAGERSMPVLLRMAGVRSFSQEVGPIADSFTPSTALAVVGNGPVDRVLANFFLRIFAEDDFPARYFDDESEAVAWLSEFTV